MDYPVVYWSIAILLVLAGLIGLILPAIPGAPLIFAGLLLAAWAENFAYVGFWSILTLALIVLLSYGVDFWATIFGARRFGASKRAAVGALLGALAGLFLGLPGVIFGPFIGAVIGELSAQRNFQQAARAGIGATIGFILGTALKMALACAMIGIFILERFL
jgi:uncharacterized protein YqgC (DUF456 family)